MDYKYRKSSSDIEDLIFQDKSAKPIVYAGLVDQKSVLYFNDYFEKKPIYELINNIEMIRQVGSYSTIDLYFTSNGGYIDSLFVLADYLNNIEDIEINFIVTGMVASCGFNILVLIDNEHIHLNFNDFCTGLIHFADNIISSRAQQSSEADRYVIEKFAKAELDRLNNWFKSEILPYLGLSKTDLKHLEEGKDVLLTKEELEEAVANYKEYKYVTSDEFEIAYNAIDDQIKELKRNKAEMSKLRKKYSKKK